MHVASVAKQWSSEMNWRHFFGYKQYPKGERIWGFVLFFINTGLSVCLQCFVCISKDNSRSSGPSWKFRCRDYEVLLIWKW